MVLSGTGNFGKRAGGFLWLRCRSLLRTGRRYRLTCSSYILWLAVASGAIYLSLPETLPLRVVLALPLMLFIPGYCVIAALFPKDGDINLIERFVLSFGLSIAIVPLIGLGLNFTPWGIRS